MTLSWVGGADVGVGPAVSDAEGEAVVRLGEAEGEQEQQDTGAEGERGGERAEGSRQHLGEGVHPAVPETGEDACGDVYQADGGAGTADQSRYGFGARSAQEPAGPSRNRT